MKPLFTFGDLVLDVVASVASRLDRDTDTPGEVRSAPGGSAANFAVWTRRLGGAVRYVGRVGDDLLGRALADDIRREGVEAQVALDPVHPTAVLVLFSEGSQRHMMVPRGANHHLDADDIPPEWVRTAGWLHLTGYAYFWEGPRRAAQKALALAREAGIPISLDPSSAGFIRRHGLPIPEGVQLLLPNQEECLALAGLVEEGAVQAAAGRPATGRAAADPDGAAAGPGHAPAPHELAGLEAVEAAARRLAERVPMVAVKLGPAGAMLAYDGRLVYIEPAEPDGPVVDATGAGDAWGAAFIHGLRTGLLPEEAARRANQLGALLVARVGARAIISQETGVEM